MQYILQTTTTLWHPPNIGADFLGREGGEENLRCLAEADRRLQLADLARKHGHSRMHQMSSPAHARQHRESVVVVSGLLQDNAIQLKTFFIVARNCTRLGLGL